MRIEIEIPKEFEEHFNQDKFKDSFGRIMEEIGRNLRSRYCSYAGRYEYETIEMLQKAFENSRQAYPVDKVVEELEERKALYERLVGYESKNGTITEKNQHIKAIDVLNDATKIVKQGGVSDDVCEWELKNACYTTSIKHYYSLPTPIVKTFNNCPYCGKKIKVVE